MDFVKLYNALEGLKPYGFDEAQAQELTNWVSKNLEPHDMRVLTEKILTQVSIFQRNTAHPRMAWSNRHVEEGLCDPFYMFPRLYKTKCILVAEPLPSYKFLGTTADDTWAEGQPNQLVIGEVSLFYTGNTFRWKIGSCVTKDRIFSPESAKYLGYVKKCLEFIKEHNGITIDLEMCGSDKVLHAFSVEWLLDAFMDGKVFCYTERTDFLVAGDNTVLDEAEKVH
jgi:hypothetical protein